MTRGEKLERELLYGVLHRVPKVGPTQCSRLPIIPHSATELHTLFGGGFDLIHHDSESHMTTLGNNIHILGNR